MRRLLLASVLAASSVAISIADPGASVEAAPDGFVDVEIADVDTLTAIEALPDGRMIALEKGGRVLRVDDRSSTVRIDTMADFDVCTASERGLLGFTTDPEFTTSGTVYVYRTVEAPAPGGCVNRVSSFDMNETGIDVSSEKILVDQISSNAGNHNGGDIEIGNDGFLYIAVGDAGRDPRGDSGSGGANDAAQDVSLLNGKILRVQRSDGRAVAGNPFSGAGTADCRVRGNTAATPRTPCREIYAFGLRNPYRFAFDPIVSSTRFFINDVGQGDREEVNLSSIGANYGWPMREGRCPQGQNPPCAGPNPGVVDPVTDYSHGNGLFITGGAMIPNGAWPSQYDGSYLASDGAFGTVWVWRGGSNLASSEVFDRWSNPTDMVFVNLPTTVALWYVQQDGEIHKVTAPAGERRGPNRNGLESAVRVRLP